MKMRLLIASGFLMCAMRVFAGLSVDGLTVDTLRNPLGIDNPRPRFSWKLQSETPSTVQVAYEVRVAESSSNGAGEWRSTGKVDSENSLYIPYAGPMLASTTSYQWQVRVWDNHGNVSGWSQVARWETGFMQPGEWRAQWITYPWDDDKESSQPSPLLRKQFELKERVVRARLYITSLGLYEAYLNGDRIGDAYFTPGWTSYDKRLQYQVYDVTAALKDGKNALGVMLADGWYRGFLSWDNQRNVYGDRLALLAQLNVEYSDGSRELIATDNSWSAGTGEIRAADIYNGELQDLRLHEEGWSRPDFSAHGWRSAQPYIGKIPKLVASAAQPVRQMELVKPVALLRGPRNEVILDMGQNMVGWLRFDARGEAGRHITLYHTEVLDRDGALYRKALRSAAQKVEYILPDDRVHTLQPHFSFQGFRYVQVDNYPGEIRLDDFTGVALHSDLPPIGHFETSDAMLNQLQSNIRWGQKGNFLDVPTDCPQRDERLGWTGDIQVFASTAAFNMDSSAFLRKWLADVELDQYENGGIPFVVPDVLARLRVHSFQSFFFQLKNSASGWGDAITIAPHALYQQYGDRAFIEEFYDSMKRWVEYERARAGSSLFTWIDYRNWFSSQRRADDRFVWNGSFTFGDWLAPKPASKAFINTVYFAHSAQLLSEAAHLLDKSDDEREYARLARDVRAAFQRRFATEQGLLTEDVQGAYVLALQYDLLEPGLRAGAARRLHELVRESGNHLATGFLSTPHLLGVLANHGYLDTAYSVLQQESYPSWLYPITKGATTIWERWGSIQPDGSFGDDGMNSFNHYAYGAVGDWMYRHIGGIAPLQPGYKEIRIAPQPGGTLTSANTSLESPYGRIAVAWHGNADVLAVNIEVPVNTRAEFTFPLANAELWRGAMPLTSGNGVESVRRNSAGQAVLILGSGRYSFSNKSSPAPGT